MNTYLKKDKSNIAEQILCDVIGIHLTSSY